MILAATKVHRLGIN